MIKVLVTGASGMLGSMLVDYFSKQDDIKLTATVRDDRTRHLYEMKAPSVSWKVFDADPPAKDLHNALQIVNGNTWIINAIGVIKPCIDDNQHESIARAVRVNSIFPCELRKRAYTDEANVIQIATDCVFSGHRNYGNYKESDLHNAEDVYGKTKSLGEIVGDKFYNLRCSIIGPESRRPPRSFLEWFLGQKDGGQIEGYPHHHWNGLTTLHFAKICLGIMRNKPKLPNTVHVIPRDMTTKLHLLTMLRELYGKEIDIESIANGKQCVRTLVTENEEVNNELWKLAGYDAPPFIKGMLEELVEYDYGMKS